MAAHRFVFVTFAIATVGFGSCQTAARIKPPSNSPVQSKKPAAEVYRQVTREDGIRFYSRASSIEVVPDPNEKPREASFHEEGFECGVIGNDGKEIAIELITQTVDHSRIQTKAFGILKLQVENGMAASLFATESQIKKLIAFQLTGKQPANVH